MALWPLPGWKRENKWKWRSCKAYVNNCWKCHHSGYGTFQNAKKSFDNTSTTRHFVILHHKDTGQKELESLPARSCFPKRRKKDVMHHTLQFCKCHINSNIEEFWNSAQIQAPSRTLHHSYQREIFYQTTAVPPGSYFAKAFVGKGNASSGINLRKIPIFEMGQSEISSFA